MSHLVQLEIKKMHQTTQKYWEVFYRGREKARLELHAQRKELEGREKDLQRSQVKNENERRKLYLERKNVIFFGCLNFWISQFLCVRLRLMLHLFKFK